MKKETYVCNAFSLQMLKNPSCTLKVQEVEKLPEGLTSAIGHPDTAKVLGYEANRVNVSLENGETIYIAQLMGGRLPEGATKLPEGFSFKYYEITVL